MLDTSMCITSTIISHKLLTVYPQKGILAYPTWQHLQTSKKITLGEFPSLVQVFSPRKPARLIARKQKRFDGVHQITRNYFANGQRSIVGQEGHSRGTGDIDERKIATSSFVFAVTVVKARHVQLHVQTSVIVV